MAAPLILGPASDAPSAATGVTRVAYRRAIQEELGEFAVLTTAAAPSSGVTPDAARQVLCSTLGVDDKLPSRFDGFFLYVVDGVHAGAVRQVYSGTFDGPIASLLLDRPFSSPLATATAVELSAPLPGDRHLTVKGVNQIVNEALARIWIETRLALTGNGTRSVSLTDYSYLAFGDQIDSLWTRWSATAPYDRSPHGARVAADGADLTLVTDWAIPSGEAFQVRVLRRADTLVSTAAGVWSASTAGLQADANQAAAPLHWVRAFGMTKALRACITLTRRDRTLDRRERADAIAEYERRLRTWSLAAVRIVREEFPRPTPRAARGLLAGSTTSTPAEIGAAFGTGWP